RIRADIKVARPGIEEDRIDGNIRQIAAEILPGHSAVHGSFDMRNVKTVADYIDDLGIDGIDFHIGYASPAQIENFIPSDAMSGGSEENSATEEKVLDACIDGVDG